MHPGNASTRSTAARFVPSPRAPRIIAIIAVLIASVAFIYMQLAMPYVHPIKQPVSMFELEPMGQSAYIAGTIGMAIACAALVCAYSLTVQLPLTAAGVALVLTVIFPTDPGHGVSSIAGQIHRYSSGAAFCFIIIAGFILTAHTAPAKRKAWMLALSIINTAAMLTITTNTFFPDLANGGDWRGLPQRILLIAQAALLILMAATRTPVKRSVKQ